MFDANLVSLALEFSYFILLVGGKHLSEDVGVVYAHLFRNGLGCPSVVTSQQEDTKTHLGQGSDGHWSLWLDGVRYGYGPKENT